MRPTEKNHSEEHAFDYGKTKHKKASIMNRLIATRTVWVPFAGACKRSGMLRGRMSLSNTVGPTLKRTGCRRWQPIWFVDGLR